MTDLIKRSDAIGAITNHCENECYYRVDNWCPQCQREDFQEAIKAIPSADRPQGEWKPFDLTWGRSVWYCSACEESTEVPCDIWTHKPIYKYCPNCGCRMKGADDGSR